MMNSLKLFGSAFAVVISMAQIAVAADPPRNPSALANSEAADLTDAEIRRIDLEAGKITLKHAPIKELDMPAMTMVFTAKDKAMLEQFKAGDKVKFRAINDGGKYTITELKSNP